MNFKLTDIILSIEDEDDEQRLQITFISTPVGVAHINMEEELALRFRDALNKMYPIDEK